MRSGAEAAVMVSGERVLSGKKILVVVVVNTVPPALEISFARQNIRLVFPPAPIIEMTPLGVEHRLLISEGAML